MKPSEKSEGIDKAISSFSGKDRKEVITGGQCALCDNPNTDFRNEKSIREYKISGMCQDCQDRVFGFD
jgi:hypothetical protein